MSRKLPTVLVVDDEPDICANLQDILTEFGYRVDTAASGEKALQLVSRNRYDVALLDLKMPGMSGVEVYRAIKRRSSDTVAVIISAYASTSTAKEALDAGAMRILGKPVEVADVMGCIEEALNQPLVMVVDDDEDLCDSLWDVLHSQGIRVKLAHTVADATAALKDENYQVAIVDFKLPEGDGLQFCAQVRQNCPAAKTILITGHRAELDLRPELRSTDATCFKPFDMNDLLATIRRLTESQRSASSGQP